MIPYKLNPLGVVKSKGETPIVAAYSNCVANDRNIYYTKDFQNWQVAEMPFAAKATARFLTCIDGKFFVFATDADAFLYRIAWTTDFQSWKTDDGTVPIYNPEVLYLRCVVPLYSRNKILFAMAHESTTIGTGMYPIYYNANTDTIDVDNSTVYTASSTYSNLAHIDNWNTGIATIYCSTNNAHVNIGTVDNWASNNVYSVAANAGNSATLSYVPNASTPFIVSARIKSNTSLASYTGTTIANLIARTSFAQTNSNFLNNAGTAYYVMPYGSHSAIYKFSANANPTTVNMPTATSRQFTKDTMGNVFCAHYTSNNHMSITVYNDDMVQQRTAQVEDGTYLRFLSQYAPLITWCPVLNKIVMTCNSRVSSAVGCFIVIDPDTLEYTQSICAGSAQQIAMAVRIDGQAVDYGSLSGSITQSEDYGDLTSNIDYDKSFDAGNIGYTQNQ